MYVLLNAAGTGVNKILGNEDSNTHYIDGNYVSRFSLIEVSKGLCSLRSQKKIVIESKKSSINIKEKT